MGSLCSAVVTPVRVRSGSGPVRSGGRVPVGPVPVGPVPVGPVPVGLVPVGPVPVGPVPVGPVPSAKCVDLRAPWGALGIIPGSFS